MKTAHFLILMAVQDENRLLRHVSPAFSEDPLRVLRVARFAARFHSFGFTIAPETLKLMREMVQSGELKHLTAERVVGNTESLLKPIIRTFILTFYA